MSQLPDGDAPRRRNGALWLGAALLAAVSLYANPHWIDAEDAHRFSVLAAVGVLVLGNPGAFSGRPPTASLLWLGLTLAHGLGFLRDGANLGAGLVWCVWLLAGFAAMQWGRRLHPAQVALIALPATTAVATLGLLEVLFPETFPIGGGPGFGGGTSTLGNRNAFAEWVALGAVGAATLSLGSPFRIRAVTLTALCLQLAALSIGWAGARGGLLAASLGISWCAWIGWRSAGATPDRSSRPVVAMLAAAVLGIGLGWVLQPPPNPATTPETPSTEAAGQGGQGSPRAQAAAEDPTASGRNRAIPSTTAMVRLELWKATTAMAGERPLMGQGGGQLPVEFPRFRTEAERTLSSRDYLLPTEVRSAHNDHLQVLAESGALGLGLWCAFWVVALLQLRRCCGPLALAIPLAWLVLATVRSPLANGPAALLLWLTLGATHGPRPMDPLGNGQKLGIRLTSAVLLALGIGALTGASEAARFKRARQANQEAGTPIPEEAVGAVATAAEALPWDPLYPALVARTATDPEVARRSIERALDLAPHHPGYRTFAAQLALARGDLAEMATQLAKARSIAPRDPQAAVLSALLHFRQREPGRAIQALLPADPAGPLREVAGQNLEQFANQAAAQGWEPDATRYRCDAQLWQTALLLRGIRSTDGMAPSNRDEIQRSVARMVRSFRSAGTLDGDRRPWLLRAAWAAAQGDTRNTEQLAGVVRGIPGKPSPGWATHLSPALLSLQGKPGWRGLLMSGAAETDR